MAGRVSQEPREVVLTPTDSKARVSQEPREVLVAPTDSKARVSQEPREVLVKVTDSKARVSQLVREVLVQHINIFTAQDDDYTFMPRPEHSGLRAHDVDEGGAGIPPPTSQVKPFIFVVT